MQKNNIDRIYLNKTDQTQLNTEPLLCKLCGLQLLDNENVEKIEYVGETVYYHEACGKQLVFDAIDKLPIEEKYGGNKDE